MKTPTLETTMDDPCHIAVWEDATEVVEDSLWRFPKRLVQNVPLSQLAETKLRWYIPVVA